MSTGGDDDRANTERMLKLDVCLLTCSKTTSESMILITRWGRYFEPKSGYAIASSVVTPSSDIAPEMVSWRTPSSTMNGGWGVNFDRYQVGRSGRVCCYVCFERLGTRRGH